MMIFSLVFSPFLNFRKIEAATGYPVPHVLSMLAVTVNGGDFLPVGHTSITASTTTEALAQTYMFHSGSWSGLSVYIKTANASGDMTFTLRKNGSDTSVTVTVPQNSTGLFQDSSNSVSVSSGDLMSIGVTETGGSIDPISITTLFQTDSGDSVQYLRASVSTASFGSVTRYIRPAGELTNTDVIVEANAQNMIQHAGSIVGLATYVSSNARTVNATLRSRINAANGNHALTVTAGSTGMFTTTNTDSLSAGDLIDVSLATGTSSGTFVVASVQLAIVSSNPREITLMGGLSAQRTTATTNQWSHVGGSITWSGSTENTTREYLITPGVLSGMAYYASANTASQNLTIATRKNTADGNQTITYSGTGWMQDTTNSDTLDNDDYINIRSARVATGTGSTTFRNTSIKYTMDTISPTYNQSAYRFFNNNNGTDVGSALAAQDTAATLAAAGDAFRLRLLIHVATNRLDASGQNFKLQYVGKGSGTCASPSGGTPSSYTDVTTSTLISYKDNATPTDGSALTSNANDPTDGAHTIVNQTYEEANNFTNSQALILSGQDGKWDFSLYDNGAAAGTAYCLRVVQSDDTVLGTYTAYPQITTASSSQSITFSISDNTVGFGTLTTGATRYATGDTTGTTSETVAHTLSVNTNATSGYSLSVKGATLTNGSFTVTSCGASCTPSAGTEQFGLRVTASGGTGAVSSPYNHASNYAYQGSSTSSSEIGSATSGDGVTTTYSVRYVGNIASTTEAGSYSASYTYTVTPSF